ncbi:MAG: VOC family protein [Oscillospiraceae bacterium]|jgi:PhnB protein|nr:VOC family protein [Oscillospiraceae bacterium]
MLIPHLHFNGDCEEAIALYEVAFHTKVREIDRAGDGQINHASMKIHRQTVFLNDNDMLLHKDRPFHFPVHLIVQFRTEKDLLACYEVLKDGSEPSVPFAKTSYSALVGNFTDKFGMLWGFMVA